MPAVEAGVVLLLGLHDVIVVVVVRGGEIGTASETKTSQPNWFRVCFRCGGTSISSLPFLGPDIVRRSVYTSLGGRGRQTPLSGLGPNLIADIYRVY